MTGEPNRSHSEPPPLRIHHLMVWMAVTGTLISVTMWFDRTARNGPPIKDRAVITALIVGAIAIAAAITLFGFAVYWRKQGIAFPRQPGDLLSIIVAKSAFYVCAVVLGVFVVFFIFGDDDWQSAYYVLALCIAAIGWVRMNINGYARYADTTAWRTVYVASIVAPGFVLAMTFMRILSTLPLAAVVATLMWATWFDRRHHLDRKWTHWVGVFVAISLDLALVAIFGR